MTVVPDDPFGGIKTGAKKDEIEPSTINRAHARDDLDSSSVAHHHTLGIKANQAAGGAHTHDGISSKKLLTGITLTGSKAAYNASLTAQIVDALERLGATDGTT